MLEPNRTVVIEIFNKKIFELNLNKNERNITFFEELDIAVIQINDLKELCISVKFLEIDLNYKKGYDIYLNTHIFILGYPLRDSVESSPGKISKISDNELWHNCHTDRGSSGSPIILVSNLSVIGIHKAGLKNAQMNLGTFLGKFLMKKSTTKIIIIMKIMVL